LFVLAGYAWGPSNSTKCPSTYFRIATEDACDAAAAANGKTYVGPASPSPNRPKGCFWNEEGGNNVFFNPDPVGAAFPRRLPLCIGALNPSTAISCAAPIRSYKRGERCSACSGV
jgi:hypothetical protein